MLFYVMAKSVSQDFEYFDSLVDGLMPTTRIASLRMPTLILHESHSRWSFDKKWIFSLVSIICFNTLALP
jgi:hypothetical protein